MSSPSESGTGFVRASALYEPGEGHTLRHVELRADWAVAVSPEVRRP